jgi:hypothetical protein
MDASAPDWRSKIPHIGLLESPETAEAIGHLK